MYRSEVVGKQGITARVVADSISEQGKRITTFELEYPRFIHSEVCTHRQFSRNAMSSRAVPIKKMIEQVETSPAMPVHWGKNQPGMQAKEEHENAEACKAAWKYLAAEVAGGALALSEEGLHKQVVNRILEPFQMMKTVVTATEWDNFFWLRHHEDAQPEFYELASCMKCAMGESVPEELEMGYYHTPYVSHMADGEGGMQYYIDNNGKTEILTLEEALKVSASCCAQVSYRILNNSKDKAISIYHKLIESVPVHASPVEHQATPIEYKSGTDDEFIPFYDWPEGITHQDRNGKFWSGNFCGWIQNRQLIPNHVKESSND